MGLIMTTKPMATKVSREVMRKVNRRVMMENIYICGGVVMAAGFVSLVFTSFLWG